MSIIKAETPDTPLSATTCNNPSPTHPMQCSHPYHRKGPLRLTNGILRVLQCSRVLLVELPWTPRHAESGPRQAKTPGLHYYSQFLLAGKFPRQLLLPMIQLVLLYVDSSSSSCPRAGCRTVIVLYRRSTCPTTGTHTYLRTQF